MKNIAALSIALTCATTAYAQTPPKMKMTTEIPPGITTPDSWLNKTWKLGEFELVK